MIADLPVLVTGDDFQLPVDLTTNDLAFVVDVNAEVKARVVSLDHRTAWSAAVAQIAGTAGADWPNGRVAVFFTAAETAAIVKYGLAQIEIQVNQFGGKSTWFAGIRVVKGQID